MVMAVIRRPPEHAFLRGHGGDKGHDELKCPAGLKRTVREVTMISRGHKKHAHVVHGQANDQIGPMEFQKEGGQAGQMDCKKREGTYRMSEMILCFYWTNLCRNVLQCCNCRTFQNGLREGEILQFKFSSSSNNSHGHVVSTFQAPLESYW